MEFKIVITRNLKKPFVERIPNVHNFGNRPSFEQYGLFLLEIFVSIIF